MKNIINLLLICFSQVNYVLNASISVGQYFCQTSFSDAQGWGVIGGSAGFDTQLGKSIFGGGGTNGFGAGVIIYKQIILPPNHHTLKIKFRFWAINHWENEYILLKADGLEINKQLVHSGLKTNFAQYLYQEIYFFHLNPSLLLEITSTLDQVNSDESWGVRDIEIIALTCPGICEQCVYTDDETSCSTYALQQTDFANLVVTGNEGWYVYNYPVTQKYCDQISLFGYYPSGTTISKQFLITKTYFRALIKFQFWKIDAVSTSIHYLYANGNLIWTFDSQNSKKISICGSNSVSEEYQNIQIELIMNFQLVTLLFISDNTANEYYGIRDLYIYIDGCIPDNIVCSNDAMTLADSQTVLSFYEQKLELQGTFTVIPIQWQSYQQLNAQSRISAPKCSKSSTVIQFMPLYDVLFKDFVLGDHKTIKMIFYLYTQSTTNTIKLQVDDTFSQDISIGYNGITLDCTSSDVNKAFEIYRLHGVELPHTGSLARVQFVSQIYQGGSFLQGFNKFGIYTGNCDCATCTYISGDPCQIKYSLVDMDFSTNTLTSAEGWQLVTYGISLSTCDGQKLLGGFNILNKNQYVRIKYTLSSHKSIRLQMMIYFLHQWVSTEQLVILLNNVEIWRQNAIYSNFASKTCGNSATSYQVVEIDQFLSHTNSDVVLNAYIDGGSGNEFWGVNNFRLSASQEDIN